MRRNRSAWLITSVFPSLVIIYLAYWVNAWLYGPRYYYEGLYSLTLVTAAGIAWLAGWPGVRQGWQKVRPLAVTALLACLVAVDLVFYLPTRIETMVGFIQIAAVAEPDPFPDAGSPGFILTWPGIDHGGHAPLDALRRFA